MTAKERVLKAMAGGKPDRVPLFVSSYWDHQVRAADGDPFEYAFGGIDVQLRTEVATIARYPATGIHRTYAGFAQLAPGRLATDHGARWIEKPDGSRAPIPTPVPLPWTPIIEQALSELLCKTNSTTPFVRERNDVDNVVDVDLASRPHALSNDFISALAPTAAGRSVLIAASGVGVFPHTRRCMGGTEECMMAIVEQPALVETVMDTLLDRYRRIIRLAASAGADAMWCGAYEEGADVLSPELWRRMILPRHRQLVRIVHDARLRAICWFLGDCMPLLEDLADAGYDLLMLEQGRGSYTSDVGQMRRRVGNKLCISGWLPELALLNDDRETIRRHLHEQYNAAGRDGAYVISTSMVDSNVAPETIEFICRELETLT